MKQSAVSIQHVPALDSNLAKPCAEIGQPDVSSDYDQLSVWMLDVLQKYADCSIRHDQTVRVYNSMRSADGQETDKQ